MFPVRVSGLNRRRCLAANATPDASLTYCEKDQCFMSLKRQLLEPVIDVVQLAGFAGSRVRVADLLLGE